MNYQCPFGGDGQTKDNTDYHMACRKGKGEGC